ncbi:MAG: hypothetical protein OXK73_16260 [Rhodospirillaceae bacterium]|nr:hypothetical protein [Rhodospirillaceae bacterium]
MSALDGWIDVCRAGTWRDMGGKDVCLDEDRLDRIVAAHAAADPAPVVVGHPKADAPAYAWIAGLRRSGDRLQAKLRDISAPFRQAVEAGLYAGRSIALQGDTLRHLGFLGGRAPAVPGLAPTCFASAPETVIAFADSAVETPQESSGAQPDSLRALGPRGDEDGSSLVPLRVPQGRGEAEEEGKDPPSTAPAGEDRDSGRAAFAERETALAEREAILLAREAAAAADDRRRAAEAAIAPHVEAGRVLPAERAALAALLAALGGGQGSDDEGAASEHATIAFASASGGEERMPPAAILERFIEGLPRRVDYRTLAGGPVPGASAFTGTHEDAGEDSERIAAEARALMTAEAERGVSLTPAEAVDRARAKRGLGTEGGTQ